MSQYPPGQYPPGQYPPGQYPPGEPPARPAANGAAVAALVLGILALLFFWVPFANLLAVVMGVVGIVLGAVGRGRARRTGSGGAGAALAGILLSAAAIVLSLAVTVGVIAFLSSHQDELRRCTDQGLTQQQQRDCVRDVLTG